MAAPTWSRGVGALLLSLLVTTAGYWLLSAGGMPIVPPPSAWASVDAVWVAAYVLMWLLVLWLRSVRWVWLLTPQAEVSSGRVTLVGLVGLAAIVILPLRLGEFVRPVLIRKYERVSSLTAVGTVAAERIIDGVCLSSILLVALQLRPIVGESRTVFQSQVSLAMVATAVQSMATLFAVALVLIAASYWQRNLATKIVRHVVSIVSVRAAEASVSMLDRLFQGFAFLPHRGYLAKFIAATLVYWTLNGGGFWVLARGCGVPIDVGQGFVCLGLLALGVLIPNAPGFFGIFQSSVYLGLALYISGAALEEHGAAFVFLLYVIQIGATLVVGGGAWAWLRAIAPQRATGP